MKTFKKTLSSWFANTKEIEPLVKDIVIQKKILVLGFFDRGNLGDEAFKLFYSDLFPHCLLMGIDDIQEIGKDISIVIIAGGDVCNDYFMPKIERLLKNFMGPCYAFNIGIPYRSCMHYLTLFDHVVLRSKQDLQEVTKLIGERNVEYMPDVTQYLKRFVPIVRKKKLTTIRIAICLAQPAFSGNQYEDSLIDSWIKIIHELTHEYARCEINLLAFNTSSYLPESDCIINNKIYAKVKVLPNVKNITDPELKDPIKMMSFMSQMNLIIGMRFHSIVFSTIVNVPFVAVYCTRKIDNFLKDNDLSLYGCKMPIDDDLKPLSLDVTMVMSIISKRMNNVYEDIYVDTNVYDKIHTIVTEKKTKQYLIRPINPYTLDETMQRVKSMTMKFLNKTEEEYEQWMGEKLCSLEFVKDTGEELIDFARLICFAITNKVGTSYIWGLCDNMKKDTFNPRESIKWIYYDNLAQSEHVEVAHDYYPLVNPERLLVIDMNYMSQDNYEGLHRSGWSYVIGGLQHLESRNLHKEPQILVDTCVERSFLWGEDIMINSNIIPYKTAWTGFIHHTFENTYSKYNCNTLLKSNYFLESLLTCKCLFVLSEYLAEQLRAALLNKGYTTPVFTLMHPTLFVENNFEIEKFVQNPNKKVVQIGAWLRNPYAIYATQIPKDNKLHIGKAALKGKEMDNYFRPEWLFDKMFDLFKQENLISEEEEKRSSLDFLCRPNMCRPETSMCRTIIKNKYVEGLLKHSMEQDNSVEILSFLTNDEFDDLMANNIVMIELVDASGCNTCVECIARNGVFLVNRLPSLEEYLGKNYPGFYTSLHEASCMAQDLGKIYEIHEYMRRLDKTKLHLDAFLKDFQEKLLTVL
jgi:hypothetical protein